MSERKPVNANPDDEVTENIPHKCEDESKPNKPKSYWEEWLELLGW